MSVGMLVQVEQLEPEAVDQLLRLLDLEALLWSFQPSAALTVSSLSDITAKNFEILDQPKFFKNLVKLIIFFREEDEETKDTVVESTNSDAANLEASAESLFGKIDKLVLENESLKAELESFNNKADEGEEKDIKITDLEAEVKRLKEEKVKAENAFESLEKEMAEKNKMQGSISAISEDTEELRRELEEKEKLIADLENEVTLLEEEKEEMKKIPEGPKGAGLRALKAESPSTVKKMGFFKKGGMMCSPRKEAAGAMTMPTRNATRTNT